jgi:DNA-binding transcriptional regulator LsrR (DeoR family)
MTPLAARMIRELYFVGKLKQAQIAKAFGIRQNSVSRIVSGLVWNNRSGFNE